MLQLWDKESFNTMSTTDKLMQRFLTKLHSVEVKEAFEILEVIINQLETKNDPEPSEVHLVSNGYQALEKLNLLEGILKKKISESPQNTGDKLDDLYSRSNGINVFDD